MYPNSTKREWVLQRTVTSNADAEKLVLYVRYDNWARILAFNVASDELEEQI
jgi:hypothetical protein